MPLDSKRAIGPENSTPYRLHSVNNIKTFEQLLSDVFDKNGVRKDGRAMNELRDMFGRVGVVSHAKGSAYLEVGKTKVIVSVFEPREIPKQTEFSYNGELFCEFKYAPFASTNRIPLQPGNEEREMAASIRRALEPTVLRHLFENFQIDIFVYVLENDGGCLAAAINAVGLALADAEVPLYDIITATTVGIQGKHIFIDPTAAEEKLCIQSQGSEGSAENNHGILVMATLQTLEQVTEFWQHGAVSLDTILEVTELFKTVNKEVFPEVQAVLMDKLDRFLEQKKRNEKQKNTVNAVVNNKS